MTKNKKMNSYIKFVLWMALGSVIGAAISICLIKANGSVQDIFQNSAEWISNQMLFLMCALAVISIFVCFLCYFKGNSIIGQFDTAENDEQLELLEKKHNFWGTLGITVSNTAIYLSLGLLTFGLSVGSNREAVHLFFSALMLLLIGLVCGLYQVALVKQLKKKDPLKQGEASDFKFTKTWLNSCDEAEKSVIYEAGYRTFQILKTTLMVLLVIAMTAELFFSTGLFAVVLLTICNIVSTAVYSYYSVRLEKVGLNIL